VTAIDTTGRDLTPELADLMEWEKPIESGLRSFVEVGNALAAIRDGKKYKVAGYTTFDDYCRQRWGISRQHAHRSIQAATVIAEMSPIGDILPTTESQVRPLAAVPDPEERAAVWEQAVENSGGDQPTAAEVAAVVAERNARPAAPAPIKIVESGPNCDPASESQGAVMGRQPDSAPPVPQRLGHPATYSRAVLNMIASYLEPGQSVLDPFAGVGTIHELASRCGVQTVGVELESEWADMHPHTICADSRTIGDLFEDTFDVVATSPAYGNRMADHHDARDGSHRNTYKHMLGRDLTEGNGAGMQWGDAYRQIHAAVWTECAAVLDEGGRFILNIKDHVRGGEVQHVASWHVDYLCRHLQLHLVAHHIIPGAGLPSGENDDLRVVGEEIYVFQKENS
jgi:hypothetical protein